MKKLTTIIFAMLFLTACAGPAETLPAATLALEPPTRTPTLIPSVTPTFTPSPVPTKIPTPTFTPTPPPNFTFEFDNTTTAEEQSFIMQSLYQAYSFYPFPSDDWNTLLLAFDSSNWLMRRYWEELRIRSGITLSPTALDALQNTIETITVAGGDRELITVHTGNTAWINNPPPLNKAIIAHEYFHTVQMEYAGMSVNTDEDPETLPFGPSWLVEGSAALFGFWVADQLNEYTLEEARDLYLEYAGNAIGKLVNLEEHNEYQFGQIRGTGFIATYRLFEKYGGMEANFSYWESIGNGKSWRENFRSAFGISAEDFYTEFDAYSWELFPLRLRGTITNRNGIPINNVIIQACPWGPENAVCATARTATDGSFEILFKEPGDYSLSIYHQASDTKGYYTASGEVIDDLDQIALIRIGEQAVTDLHITMTLSDKAAVQYYVVSGTIKAKNGKPFPHLFVGVCENYIPGNPPGKPCNVTDTDEQGKFSVGVPDGGTYIIIVGGFYYDWEYCWVGGNNVVPYNYSCELIHINGAGRGGIQFTVPEVPKK